MVCKDTWKKGKSTWHVKTYGRRERVNGMIVTNDACLLYSGHKGKYKTHLLK